MEKAKSAQTILNLRSSTQTHLSLNFSLYKTPRFREHQSSKESCILSFGQFLAQLSAITVSWPRTVSSSSTRLLLPRDLLALSPSRRHSSQLQPFSALPSKQSFFLIFPMCLKPSRDPKLSTSPLGIPIVWQELTPLVDQEESRISILRINGWEMVLMALMVLIDLKNFFLIK